MGWNLLIVTTTFDAGLGAPPVQQRCEALRCEYVQHGMLRCVVCWVVRCMLLPAYKLLLWPHAVTHDASCSLPAETLTGQHINGISMYY